MLRENVIALGTADGDSLAGPELVLLEQPALLPHLELGWRAAVLLVTAVVVALALALVWAAGHSCRRSLDDTACAAAQLQALCILSKLRLVSRAVAAGAHELYMNILSR